MKKKTRYLKRYFFKITLVVGMILLSSQKFSNLFLVYYSVQLLRFIIYIY